MKSNKQKPILIGIILIIVAVQAHAAYIGGYKEIRYMGDLLINATGTLNIAVNETSKLYIASNGFTGIGTTLPSERLDIDGAIKIGTTTTTNTGTIRFLNDIFQGHNGSEWLTLSGGSVSGTAGWTDDGANVRLTTLSDSVGIGIANPGARLHINGTGITLNISNSTHSHLYVDSTIGYVGIGTTSPAATLHINSADGIVLPIGTTEQRPSTPANGTIRFNTNSSQFEGFSGTWGSLGGLIDIDMDTYISAETGAGADNDELRFFTAGAEVMRADAGGKIGVNTTSPKGNLHVNGSAYFENGNVGIGTTTPSVLLDVGGTINGSAVTVNGVNVALHSGFSGENITSGIVADARIVSTITRDSELENTTIIRYYNSSWVQAIKATNATHADTSSISYDLSCTNCIGGTEIAELADADISNTLTASDLVAVSSVVADSEVDNDITIHSTKTINTTGGLNVTGGAYIKGAVGIGTNSPGSALEVVGNITLSQANSGIKSVSNQDIYINAGSGDVIIGDGTGKFDCGTIDPTFNLEGESYASYVPSMIGVKEEFTGKAKTKKDGEIFSYVIDFDKEKKGTGLWVWKQVIDFNKDSIEAIATPYGEFANMYYYIQDNKIIFVSDKEIEFSFRLTGKRFDHEEWATYVPEKEGRGFKVKEFNSKKFK